MFGLNSAFDYFVMESAQKTDEVLAKLDEIGSQGYTIEFNRFFELANISKSDFTDSDLRRIKEKTEQINRMNA